MKGDDYRLFHLFDGRVYGTTGDARPGDSGRVIPLYTVSCHKHSRPTLFISHYLLQTFVNEFQLSFESGSTFVSKTNIDYSFGDKLLI